MSFRVDSREEGFVGKHDWDVLRELGASPKVALLYGTLFFPELVEVEGFVLIAENYDAEYLARVVAECAPENVEATINTVYLQDVLGAEVDDADKSEWTALGELVRKSWKAHAESLFPEREFAATFCWYSEGGDPGVTLFQTKPAPRRDRTPDS